jgi:hypothetical protein
METKGLSTAHDAIELIIPAITEVLTKYFLIQYNIAILMEE